MKICIACGEHFHADTWICPTCKYEPPHISNFLAFAPDLAEASEGFESGFFDQLVQLEGNNFWFRSRNQLIIWALKNYFPNAANLLEIGCGTGFVLLGLERAFPNLVLYGSEIFSTGLNFAAERLSRTTLFQMDARQIPFEQEFDVIGVFDVLEHIQSDERVLAEIYRALRPSGGIVLTVPQHPWLWSQVDTYTHHVRRYQRKELLQKVARVGFKVQRVTSFVSLLLPLMLLSRFLQQSKTDYDPLAEFKINQWINVCLEEILNLERTIIRTGFSLPLGGSLLLVAKK